MAKVPNGVETLPKISIAWVGRTNVTDDRQTDDRQTTDGRTTTYSEREREFTFANNNNNNNNHHHHHHHYYYYYTVSGKNTKMFFSVALST